jgi:DNA-binding MarR family transcriptional regulator
MRNRCYQDSCAIANIATGSTSPGPLEEALRAARRELGADVTIQRLLILLNVYSNEGLSQSELLRQLESTSITALSRNIADLSRWTSKKREGPGLLELRVDPMNLRRKTIHLTRKGKRVVSRILGAMA